MDINISKKYSCIEINMKTKISICIPTYEMNGKGVEYLNHSFNILSNQSYQNFDVVVSDNSKSSVIESLCYQWKSKLDIKHFYNHEKYGNVGNINSSIKKATGDIIKILFQDDFLFGNESLESQLTHFVGNHNHWLITACCHTKDGVNFYNPLYPKYHDNIHYGENTISSPSVLMFKNENVIEFDENLCWLMDVDYYKMLYDKFGLPSICNYVTVVNRSHPDSITNSKIVDFDVKKEIEYVKNKYG